ncbi:HAD family hydrolase [Halorubrum vacuolatum]|uniref:Haloacid dehalogenase superfamily, subfamily IA, variant 1 with third motif having Dx(3-4)D or Dx(3-4)E n=1 Tax=Halorubrum vacuolatum TaxID=63740 RepID=A0A238VCN9_HALVU|nr:HAD family hydrolase [Halorubrum vacuolatum]SNR32145.1 haloacid dehalogenase superfamily, subfamily IA, variant 1 with third motif having Dx(3-4)D or Dx(3-4)E [Halorubrum vacuolatum]
MTYDTVVFDNDGVLVGRTRFGVLREATRETFKKFGVTDPDPDDVKRMTIGATPGSVGTVCQRYDFDPGTFWRTRDSTVSKAQQVEAREGRKTPYDDLDELENLEVEMGIVSSNQQETIDFIVDHFDGFDLFGAAYGREPTIHSLQLRKPNPHYIEQALADLDAENALFVGDNESDVQAAHNAGIDSAFIRRPHRDEWELNVWPTWEIDCLADLHDICTP